MESNQLVFEEKIMIRTCLVLSIILPLATVGNIIFHLNKITILSTGFSSIFFIILYWIGVKYEKFSYLRLLITIYAIIFLNTMFLYNYGSRGPILCNFIAVLCALIFIWDKKRLPVLALIFFFNLLFLCYLDLNFPETTKQYPNEQTRIIDMYFGTIISFLFIIGYAFYSKERYTKEYLKKSQSDQFKSAFLVNLYGELKIPLKTIVGYSELLEQTDNLEKRRQYLSTISNSSKQLLLFMNDIFDVSLIESNQLILEKENTNVKQLILEVIHNIEIEKNNNSVELRKEAFPSEDFYLHTDAIRLKKILKNLVLFSIKRTIKGEVKISYTIKNKKCIISVSGEGIETLQKELKFIFNNNDYLDSEDIENFSGTALEFFVSRKIIMLLGGEIRIEAFPGKGTKFHIELPIT